MSHDWPLVVGGKPIGSIPPYVVIAFELTILLGALSTVAAVALFSILMGKRGVAYDPAVQRRPDRHLRARLGRPGGERSSSCCARPGRWRCDVKRRSRSLRSGWWRTALAGLVMSTDRLRRVLPPGAVAGRSLVHHPLVRSHDHGPLHPAVPDRLASRATPSTARCRSPAASPTGRPSGPRASHDGQRDAEPVRARMAAESRTRRGRKWP